MNFPFLSINNFAHRLHQFWYLGLVEFMCMLPWFESVWGKESFNMVQVLCSSKRDTSVQTLLTRWFATVIIASLCHDQIWRLILELSRTGLTRIWKFEFHLLWTSAILMQKTRWIVYGSKFFIDLLNKDCVGIRDGLGLMISAIFVC